MKAPVDPLASIHGALSKKRAAELFHFLGTKDTFTLSELRETVRVSPETYPSLYAVIKPVPADALLRDRWRNSRLGGAIVRIREHLKGDAKPARLFKVFESVRLEDGMWGRAVLKAAMKDDYYRNQILSKKVGDKEAAEKRLADYTDCVLIVNGKLKLPKKK